MGGFNKLVILDSLGCRPPDEYKHERRCAMEIEFYFRFKRKPKNKKVTVVVDEQ